MRASLLLHRLLLILAFAGIFVAGTLTLGSLRGATVPCGAPVIGGISGCEAVSSHPAGKWFNQPVAVYGLGAYLALAAIGLIRAAKGPLQARRWTTLGFVISLIGTTASAYLIYTATFVIQATCYWCLASASIMLLNLFLHGALLQVDVPDEPTMKLDTAFIGALAMISLGGIGFMAQRLEASKLGTAPVKTQTQVRLEDLKIKPEQFRGNPKARLTLIEYADFFCPACRSTYPKLKALEELYPDKLRVAYVNYPLFQKEGHEFSLVASGASMFAAEKGKFWEFVDVMFLSDAEAVNGREGISAALNRAGLDAKEFNRRWDAADDKLLDPIAEMQAQGDKIGVDRTPSILILRDGSNPLFVYDKLDEVLQRPEFREYLQ